MIDIEIQRLFEEAEAIDTKLFLPDDHHYQSLYNPNHFLNGEYGLADEDTVKRLFQIIADLKSRIDGLQV